MSRARRLTQCDCYGICYILPNQQIFHRNCILFFHHWQNGFTGRMKWLRGPHLARGAYFGDPWFIPTMGVHRNFSREGSTSKIWLMLFRLLTMQCKLTFTKRFILSTPLVCADRTSGLHLLSKMFSALRLSEIPFLFISCPIYIVWSRAANCHNLRKINCQNNKCGEKAKFRHSRKTASSNEKQKYMLTRLSDNSQKLGHHAGLTKLSRWITKTRHSKYSFALNSSAH